MAFLHRLRSPGSGRGLRAAVAATALLAGALWSAACEELPDSPPPPILQDSLGLTLRDQVHLVRLDHSDGAERIRPDSVGLAPGEWVDFTTVDGWPRTLRLEPVPARASDSAGGTEPVLASPPLLSVGVHWVIAYEDLPPGRYRVRASGSGEEGTALLIVLTPPS